jgi:hypothetical protein
VASGARVSMYAGPMTHLAHGSSVIFVSLLLLAAGACGEPACDPDKGEPGTDCEKVCDPYTDEPGTDCEKVCELPEDEPGAPCSRKGQTCSYGDVNCLYTGECVGGVWVGRTVCNNGEGGAGASGAGGGGGG